MAISSAPNQQSSRAPRTSEFRISPERASFRSISAAVLSISIVGILARETFAAPIRAYIPQAWYAFDALIVFAIAMGFFACAPRFPRSAILSATVIIIATTYSLQQNSPLSTAFSLRYISYFIAPIILVVLARGIGARFTNVVILLGIAASIGVLVDDVAGFQWGTQTFSGILGERVIAREWWLQTGIRRLSGFGISSTNTAHMIACVGLLCLPLLAQRSRLIALIAAALFLWAAYLTQQRASLAWFAILMTLSMALPLYRPAARTSFSSLKVAISIAIVTMIAAPFALRGIDIGSIFGTAGQSLRERTFVVWPNAIDTISTGFALVVGKGVGSIGELSVHPALRAPDNMFLNMAAMFGFPVAIALCAGLFLIAIRANMKNAVQLGSIAVATFIVLNGATANMVLSAVPMTFLGLAVASLALRPIADGMVPRATRQHQSETTL
jgi:hypothetical protein